MPHPSDLSRRDFLFFYAEYLAACREDEGGKNPPKLGERRRVDGFEEFRFGYLGALLRGASFFPEFWYYKSRSLITVIPMEEKVIPPDEKEWRELKEFFEEEFIEDFLFFRIQGYEHDEKYNEGLVTVEILDQGVILKCHAVSFSDRIDKHIYLLLSDGRWVRGLAGISYELDADSEVRDGQKFLRVTVSLQTNEGISRRILRKKI